MHLDLYNHPKNKITLTKQIAFLDRLSKLLNKHYNLKQALKFMHFDPQLNHISKKFTALLHSGHPIDDCFKLLAFHPLIISYIKFSKESSHFQDHVSHCAHLMKLRYELQNNLKKTLRYPLILLFICIAIFLAMNYYLFPSLIKSFESFGETQSILIINIMMSVFNTSLMLLLLFFLFILITIFYLRRTTIEQRIKIIKKIPLYHNIYSLMMSMQIAYQLHALLHNGKNIKESLVLLKAHNEIQLLQYFASLTLDRLSKGESFYQSIKDFPLIQNELKWLIKRSDEHGTLSHDLQQYSHLILETLEERIKRLILLIQPIIYVIVGVLVMTIYMLTIFPIYKLIQQI